MAPIESQDRVPTLEHLGYEPTSPPFAKGLFTAYSNFLSPQTFSNMVDIADAYQKEFTFNAMIREDGERTSLLYHLLGKVKKPEETQAVLTNLADSVFLNFQEEPIDLQQNILNTLERKDFCDSEAVSWIMKQYREISTEISKNPTQETKQFEHRNWDVIRSSEKNSAIYVPDIYAGRVIGVTRYIKIPHLPEENIRALQKITPIFYNSKAKYPDKLLRNDWATGLFQQIGKGNDPFTASLAWFFQSESALQRLTAFNESHP
ncbi:MAG: hypothetical protein WAV51_05195 [Microgenomates group bacterium]